MGRSVFCLNYLAVWVEDKRQHLSFNNEVWQRLPISVPWVYRVHSILMIGITGSLDRVPLVCLLPFLGFSRPRRQCLLLVPLLFHCDISSGFKKVAWFPPLPSIFQVSFVIPRSRYFCCYRKNVPSLPPNERIFWVIRQSLWRTSKSWLGKRPPLLISSCC